MVLYFLQGGPSHVFAILNGSERDVMHGIRTIVVNVNFHTMFCTFNNLDIVIRDIFDPIHVQVPLRLINTVMIITCAICKRFELDILIGDPDMLRFIRQNVRFFLLCFGEVSDMIHSQDIPASIRRTHEDMLTDISQYLNRLERLIRRRLRELVNRNEEPNSNLNQQNVFSPKYLKDEESLISCPILKEKLASSSKTLVEAAADDLCTVCLEVKISTRENFAILDKCAHLFCRQCIKQWFKTA